MPLPQIPQIPQIPAFPTLPDAPQCGPIRNSVCTMLNGYLDKGLDFLKNLQKFLDLKIPTLLIDFTIPQLPDLPHFDIPNFDTDCLSMLTDMIDNCPYLSENSLLKKTSNLVHHLDKWIKADYEKFVNDAVEEYVGTTYNEFRDFITGLPTPNGILDKYLKSVNSVLSSIKIDAMFKNLKLDKIVPDIDKMIKCLDSFCGGTSFAAKKTEFESLLIEMKITTNGSFDIMSLLQDSNLSETQKTSFSNTLSSINTVNESISQSVSSGVEIAKSQEILPSGARYLGTNSISDCNCRLSSLLVNPIYCDSTCIIVTNIEGILSPAAICEVYTIGLLQVIYNFTSSSNTTSNVSGSLIIST